MHSSFTVNGRSCEYSWPLLGAASSVDRRERSLRHFVDRRGHRGASLKPSPRGRPAVRRSPCRPPGDTARSTAHRRWDRTALQHASTHRRSPCALLPNDRLIVLLTDANFASTCRISSFRASAAGAFSQTYPARVIQRENGRSTGTAAFADCLSEAFCAASLFGPKAVAQKTIATTAKNVYAGHQDAGHPSW